MLNLNNSTKYQLSIVIVNYNVQHFLEQCLLSVRKAISSIEAEVIIVDNDSVDGSVEMVRENFPDFKLIENKLNVGFSKANNQAIKSAQGKYVLLLNPDTVVSEDTFEKVMQFMDNHDEAGGLGIRMIDGKGNFLPESKRGLPRPMVAFYKIFGLSKLFPKSKRFAQYHAGHISSRETAEVDILSGAFMLIRKSVLDKIGLLDETFFMYGEDIDLSYRIQLAGYKNYYFAESEIIHYKGESTKKSSVNYVFVFYRAMVIFAKKHFSSNNAQLYSILINCGIYLRAALAIISRLMKRLFLPVFDFIYVVVGLFALTNYWQQADIVFPEELIKYSIPIYALTWITSCYFNGSYDLPSKLFKHVKGVLLGTILILIVYAILPKTLQFSRLFIFTGSAWVLGYYIVSRIFLHFALKKRFRLKATNKKNFLVVGEKKEANRVIELIKQSNHHIGDIITNEGTETNSISEEFKEIVFCSSSIPYHEIIKFMSLNCDKNFDFKIVPSERDYLIGSNSIDTAGDLYILDLNMLVNDENRRKKRLFDVILSFFLILFSPLLIYFTEKKSNWLQNLFSILIGRKSFIGFSLESAITDVRLPKIKDGILYPSDAFEFVDKSLQDKLNLLYARDYSMRKDFSIVWKAWRNLDR